MKYASLNNVDVDGKRVLVRVDFNVPLDASGVVADDWRIMSALPTINYLINNEAVVILCSHLGRPKGTLVDQLSLRTVLPILNKSLENISISFSNNCFGSDVKDMVDSMQSKSVLLLENTRFWKEETDNDPYMSREMSLLADVFVNDAFGVAHRRHATTVGIAEYIPSVAGLLMDNEMKYLEDTLLYPSRPFVCILGGAKIGDKIDVIDRLMDISDLMLIGGGMANTFLKAKGMDVGESLVENDVLDKAYNYMKSINNNIVLPLDVIITDSFDVNGNTSVCDIEDGVKDSHMMIVDIGPKTCELYSKYILDASLVLWNGPVGAFEIPQFAEGTNYLAKSLAQSMATTVVGGGDTAAAVRSSGYDSYINHISTGGGAALEVLKGNILPALQVLGTL